MDKKDKDTLFKGLDGLIFLGAGIWFLHFLITADRDGQTQSRAHYMGNTWDQ